MRKKQQVEPPFIPSDGWWWVRTWVPLRTGGYNYEWRIARIVGGKVQPFGMSTFLEPDCLYLRHALWHRPIEPPPIGASGRTALAQQGPRRRNRRQRQEPGLRAPAHQFDPQQFRDVAEGIVRAFVESSGDLWDQYGRQPDKLAELVGEVAGVLGRAFGGG